MEARSFDVPRYLSVLPLFQEMTPPELQRLAQGSRLRRMARGDTVFRVGEPCVEFHVTVMGQVKLFALSPAGQEKVIELIGPGQTFAEALMFSDKPYIINAQVLTDTLLLSVSKEVVVSEIHREPRLAQRILAGMSSRLHGLVHDVQAYSLHTGVQRVIGYLLRDLPDEQVLPLDGGEGVDSCYTGCQKQCGSCHLNPARDIGGGQRPPVRELRVSLPVSKATIASRLSLTPEYFSRVLHELEGVGLIQIDKRDIRIPDPGRLARYNMQ